MKVLFWGTPDFASPPLRALVGEGFEVVGVVTQPDRPRGRSRSTLVPSPVKEIALAEGLPVLQPDRPRGPEFVEALRALGADISIVVAYGHILPKDVIDLPPLGTLNIHASLLPRWRGAAPIQAALLAGDRETGVSIMRMVPALDAGPVLLQAPTPVADDETAGELEMRLSELGALVLVESLALVGLGEAQETAQDESRVTYAAKIEREHARVDWSRPAELVARTVRAFDPRPGAFSTLRGEDVKLFGVRIALTDGAPSGAAGEVIAVGEEGMLVTCGEGVVRIHDVQPAGKRRLAAADWSRGRGVAVGDRLGG